MAKKLLAIVLALTVALTMGVATTVLTFAATNGSITVTNATNGQTYEAFLVFKASPSDTSDLSKGVTYTATADQVAVTGFDTYFDKVANQNGGYTITKKTNVSDDAVISFIKDNIDNLKQGNAIEGTYSDDSTVVFSGLEYGYYYITSTLGTLVSIDTAAKDVSVVDKNESTPDGPEKIIAAQDSAIDASLDDVSSSDGKTNDSSVGSVETFNVDFDATNWKQDEETNAAGTGTGTKTQITEYNFQDTPTGLAIDKDTVKVYVNWGNSKQAEITSTITDIAVDSDGALTFTIPWIDDNNKSLYETATEGSALIPVHITYDAKVLSAAATAAAPNTVVVNYNGNTKLGEDTTTTYTYKFLLKKVDENNEALDGAEFELYLGDGEDALTFTMNNGKYQYDPEGTVTKIKPTGTDASAEIIGLDNASYTLKEVVVPEGYTKADDETVTGLVKETGSSQASDTTITVENKKGAVLPSTGGIGTTIFYILGALLVIVCGVVLVARRRMTAK